MLKSELQLIFFCRYSEKTIQTSLGAADYSYYFVMRRFHRLLATQFRITTIESIEALEDETKRASTRGYTPVLLCFTPPHDIPLNAPCTVIPVFAWEFDTLPNVAWNGNIRNDWSAMLSRCPGAITHSAHTVSVVKAALTGDYPVISLPASVWDDFNAITDRAWTGRTRTLMIPGMALDTHASVSGCLPRDHDGNVSIDLQGCVFTSVLNPHDGRKNIHDIITAFTDAFRDVPDASLLLKFTNAATDHFIEDARRFIERLVPFACRIVIVSGYLPAQSFHELVRVTTWCVNASTGEGQCLPMMEFMAAGKPALSPAHTGLTDYVDGSVAIVVESSLEPACWPQDSRQMITCFRHRISWESLREGYMQAYAIAMHDRPRYDAMSATAEQRLYEHNARDVLLPRFTHWIAQVLAG